MLKFRVFIILFLSSVVLLNAENNFWIPLNVGSNIGDDFYSITTFENNIYVGANYGNLYLSSDDGSSWNKIGLPQTDSSYNFVVDLKINGTNIFAGTISNLKSEEIGIYISHNNGNTWRRYLNDKGINALEIKDNNIFAGTGGYGLYLSTDNGDSWKQTNLKDVSITALAKSGNNILAGTENGAYLSNDNGDNWEPMNLPTTSFVSSFAVSGSYTLAAVYGIGIYLSTDNGVKWEEINSPTPDVVSLAISGDIFFVGTKSGIYLSENNGDTWRFVGNPGGWIIVRLLVKGTNDIFAIHSEGSIFRAKISDLITDVKDEQPLSGDISIYPNPASDYIYINSPLIEGAGGVYEYTIFDLLGQNVQRSILTDSKIDISQLPTGVYCIVFSNSGKQIIKKFIKY